METCNQPHTTVPDIKTSDLSDSQRDELAEHGTLLCTDGGCYCVRNKDRDGVIWLQYVPPANGGAV